MKKFMLKKLLVCICLYYTGNRGKREYISISEGYFENMSLSTRSFCEYILGEPVPTKSDVFWKISKSALTLLSFSFYISDIYEQICKENL